MYLSREDKKRIIFAICLFSYLLFFGILISIICIKMPESNKLNYVYYLSKILTVKTIVLRSHYSEILDHFSSSGEPHGLSLAYKNYLKLVKNNECEENYRPCGILDTYGNLLCIDELLPCPINKMKVDIIAREYNYLSQNYYTVPLKGISDNYRLFCSNDFIDGIGTVIIVKSKEEPKYITYDSFIVDIDAFKEMFNDEIVKLVESILNGYDSNDINGYNGQNGEEDFDQSLKIVNILLNSGGEASSLNITGAQALSSLLSFSSDKNLVKFERYAKERIQQLEEEKNIDKYYNNLGDNFYSKNYIGFKSTQDLNKFMTFDFNIYKDIFPNYESSQCAAFLFSIIVFYIIYEIICIVRVRSDKYSNDKFAIWKLITSLIYYSITFGFLIYSIDSYVKVNKNPKLNELKLISSDEFINDFIKEFVSLCQKSEYVISCICIISFATIIHVASLVCYFIMHFQHKC